MFTQCGARTTTSYENHTLNMRRMKENPKSLHMSCLNFDPSSFGWVCNVCHNCWRLCHCWWDKHCSPQWIRLLRCTSWHGRRVYGSTRHTDVGWTTQPSGKSQRGQLVFIANAELSQGIKHVPHVLALESSEMCGKITICSRNSSSRRWLEGCSAWAA